MVKKVKKKIKKKKIVVRTDPPISMNYEQNENKTLETIKSWGYGIIGIVVILSIFSGFKYPWKWIDALYETQNEKIEIILRKPSFFFGLRFLDEINLSTFVNNVLIFYFGFNFI